MVAKVCKIISTILIVVLFLTACLLLLPNAFGLRSLVVQSGSMYPELGVGDMVYVKPVDPADIQVEDIITYTLGADLLATHRVIQVHEESQSFVTKGDANEVDDGPIAFDRLVGKVVYSLPHLGAMVSLVRGPAGILILGALLIVVVVITLLPEVFRKPEDREKERANRKLREHKPGKTRKSSVPRRAAHPLPQRNGETPAAPPQPKRPVSPAPKPRPAASPADRRRTGMAIGDEPPPVPRPRPRPAPRKPLTPEEKSRELEAILAEVRRKKADRQNSETP